MKHHFLTTALFSLALLAAACSHQAPVAATPPPPRPDPAAFFANLEAITGQELDYQVVTLTRTPQSPTLDLLNKFIGVFEVKYDLLLVENCRYTIPAGSITIASEEPPENHQTTAPYSALTMHLPTPELQCTLKEATVQPDKSGLVNMLKQALAVFLASDDYTTTKQKLIQEAHHKYLAAPNSPVCQLVKEDISATINDLYFDYLQQFQIDISKVSTAVTYATESCSYPQQTTDLTMDEAQQALDEMDAEDTSSDVDFITTDAMSDTASDADTESAQDTALVQEISFLLNAQENLQQRLIRNQLKEFLRQGRLAPDSCIIYLYNNMPNRKNAPLSQNTNPDCTAEKLQQEVMLLLKKACSVRSAQKWLNNFLNNAVNNGELSPEAEVLDIFNEVCRP